MTEVAELLYLMGECLRLTVHKKKLILTRIMSILCFSIKTSLLTSLITKKVKHKLHSRVTVFILGASLATVFTMVIFL